MPLPGFYSEFLVPVDVLQFDGGIQWEVKNHWINVVLFTRGWREKDWSVDVGLDCVLRVLLLDNVRVIRDLYLRFFILIFQLLFHNFQVSPERSGNYTDFP